MWIASTLGFFSVVCARKDSSRGEIDPDRVMIRARLRQHIDALRGRFSELLKCDILETANADYRFRIIVPKATWVRAFLRLTSKSPARTGSACARLDPGMISAS